MRLLVVEDEKNLNELLVRRGPAAAGDRFVLDDLMVDCASRQVSRGGMRSIPWLPPLTGCLPGWKPPSRRKSNSLRMPPMSCAPRWR